MLTFRATLAWLWDRPDAFANASLLVMVGISTIVAGQAVKRNNRFVALLLLATGVIFLDFAIAWPTGRPLPAIAHGKYDVVQMKNTNASLFLIASDVSTSKVRAWWVRKKNGEVGWNLPPGPTTPDYENGEYRSMRLCVDSTPDYPTYITDCTDGR